MPTRDELAEKNRMCVKLVRGPHSKSACLGICLLDREPLMAAGRTRYLIHSEEKQDVAKVGE